MLSHPSCEGTSASPFYRAEVHGIQVTLLIHSGHEAEMGWELILVLRALGPQSQDWPPSYLCITGTPDPTRMRTFPMSYRQTRKTAALDYLREQPAISKVGSAQGGEKDSMRK